MSSRFLPSGNRVILALVSSLLLTGAGVKPKVDAWRQYDKYTHALCPSRHIEWFPDDYDDLISGFIDTIPPDEQRLITSNLDYSGPCAGETQGGSCDMRASLVAFQRLHMLRRFAQYSCRYWTCDFAAYCHKR